MAELNTTKARQGRTGRPVLYVLIGGLALALIVFAGLGVYGSSQPNENIGGIENSGVSTAPASPTASGGAVTTTPGQTAGSPAVAPQR